MLKLAHNFHIKKTANGCVTNKRWLLTAAKTSSEQDVMISPSESQQQQPALDNDAAAKVKQQGNEKLLSEASAHLASRLSNLAWLWRDAAFTQTSRTHLTIYHASRDIHNAKLDMQRPETPIGRLLNTLIPLKPDSQSLLNLNERIASMSVRERALIFRILAVIGPAAPTNSMQMNRVWQVLAALERDYLNTLAAQLHAGQLDLQLVDLVNYTSGMGFYRSGRNMNTHGVQQRANALIFDSLVSKVKKGNLMAVAAKAPSTGAVDGALKRDWLLSDRNELANAFHMASQLPLLNANALSILCFVTMGENHEELTAPLDPTAKDFESRLHTIGEYLFFFKGRLVIPSCLIRFFM
jgi:hypothetical protein